MNVTLKKITLFFLIVMGTSISYGQFGKPLKDIKSASKKVKISKKSKENSDAKDVEAEKLEESKESDSDVPTVDKEAVKDEIDTKYHELRNQMRGVAKYLSSSSGSFDEFSENLKELVSAGNTMEAITSMVNDSQEQSVIEEVGDVGSRREVKEDILPGISDALNKKEDADYSLDRLQEELDEISGFVAVAIGDGVESDERTAQIMEFYEGALIFQEFSNRHPSLEPFVKKAEYYANSVKKSRDEKFEAFRSGDFHRRNGSGIYVVQQDGVTAETLTESMLTDKVIIDGKKPVHIFIMTDRGIRSYGSFLQFNFIDKGESKYQHKYVFDEDRMVPLDEKEDKLGVKKLVFVPSSEWGDVADNYVQSMFYQCLIQEKLATTMVPGIAQEFTIYSANSTLSKTISIEVTEEGIDFLKEMKTSMEKFAIDAVRMEKSEYTDAAMASKIAKGFISNSNGVATAVEKVNITSKPWFVKKNALGAIEYRDFYACVAFKKNDGKYYVQEVRCVSDYSNGSYQPIKVYGSGPSKEIREENISK